jgi:hypothetical protein
LTTLLPPANDELLQPEAPSTVKLALPWQPSGAMVTLQLDGSSAQLQMHGSGSTASAVSGSVASAARPPVSAGEAQLCVSSSARSTGPVHPAGTGGTQTSFPLAQSAPPKPVTVEGDVLCCCVVIDDAVVGEPAPPPAPAPPLPPVKPMSSNGSEQAAPAASKTATLAPRPPNMAARLPEDPRSPEGTENPKKFEKAKRLEKKIGPMSIGPIPVRSGVEGDANRGAEPDKNPRKGIQP